MADYGFHADCYPPFGCGEGCPYRREGPVCTHPDDRGRECRHCGVYVRGDDLG